MTTMLPYAPPDRVNIPNLDPFFGPDAPPLPDPEPRPDGMQQNPPIIHIMQILDDIRGSRPGVFVDTNTIVYYDPTNGNRRFQPDVYAAFDVDADTIRQRNGYVIWEVGKPPDFVLEVASESTADNDTGYKRDLYARVGILEYWRFDASGGDMYDRALAGEYLENGVYRSFPIRTAADGAIWGYSPMLHLNLRWNGGRLELQDPDTGEILANRRGERLAKEAALEQRDAAVQERDNIVQQRDAALTANADYREQIRRLQEQLREHGQSPE